MVHRATPVPKSQFLQELEAEEDVVYSEQGIHQHPGTPVPTPEEPTPLETAANALDVPGAVKYFTDFLKAPLHPRTIQLLDGLWEGTAEAEAWSRPGGWLGAGAGDEREAASDRIRALAEESDSLAGFQCFAEDLSAWGGVATEVLQEVRDDYGAGRTAMLWALRSGSGGAQGPVTPAEARRHRLREGLSTALLSQQCDVYVPMAPPAAHAALPMLQWRQGDIFHESAILASALDSASLPYRLKDNADGQSGPESAIGALDFWSLGNLLTGQYRTPLCALSFAFPCPTLPTNAQQLAEEIDTRERHDSSTPSNASHCFTSKAVGLSGASLGGTTDTGRFAENIVLRGARSQGSHLPLSHASAGLDASLLREKVRCVQNRTVVAQPQPIPLPYPSIFSPRLSCFGEVAGTQNAISSTGGTVISCPVLVRMAATSSFGPIVKDLSREWLGCVNAAQGRATLDSWGVDREQSEDVYERLMALSTAYDEEY